MTYQTGISDKKKVYSNSYLIWRQKYNEMTVCWELTELLQKYEKIGYGCDGKILELKYVYGIK